MLRQLLWRLANDFRIAGAKRLLTSGETVHSSIFTPPEILKVNARKIREEVEVFIAISFRSTSVTPSMKDTADRINSNSLYFEVMAALERNTYNNIDRKSVTASIVAASSTTTATTTTTTTTNNNNSLRFTIIPLVIGGSGSDSATPTVVDCVPTTLQLVTSPVELADPFDEQAYQAVMRKDLLPSVFWFGPPV